MWYIVWLMFLPWITPVAPPQYHPSPTPLVESRLVPHLFNMSRSPKGTIKPVLLKSQNKNGRRSYLSDTKVSPELDSDIVNKSAELAAALRRQLMQDNYDYMPSDSRSKETEEVIHYKRKTFTNPTSITQGFQDSKTIRKLSTYESSHASRSSPTQRLYLDRHKLTNDPYSRNVRQRGSKHKDFSYKDTTFDSYNLESEEKTQATSNSRRPSSGNFYKRDHKTKHITRDHTSTTSIKPSSNLDSFITLFDKDTWKKKNKPNFGTDLFKKKEKVNTNLFNSFEKMHLTTSRFSTSNKSLLGNYDRHTSPKTVKTSKSKDNELFREPLDTLQDSFSNANRSRYNTGFVSDEDTTTKHSTARWGVGPNHPYPHVDLTKKSRDIDSDKDYEQYIMKKLKPIMVMGNKANDRFNRKFDTLVGLDTDRQEPKGAEANKNSFKTETVSNIDHIHLGNRRDENRRGKVASFESGIIQKADPDYESALYINNKLNQALESRVTMNINERRDPYHMLKNTTDETKVNHADLLYYVDDTRLSDPKRLTFHADTPIQGEVRKPETRRVNVINDKSYKVLKIKSGNRRMGAERRFIQEEGVEGVSIVKVDPGPFPEFLLPEDRRQYMHQDDLSDSDPDPELPESPETSETSSAAVKTTRKVDFVDPNASELSGD